MNKELKKLIELIKCFEENSRFYWIVALKVDDNIKGKLCHYFKIYEMEG